MGKDTIGLKIKIQNDISSCIRILREYVGLSIGEIKERINHGDLVYECAYTDGEGIRVILDIYRELSAIGVDTEVYEHDRLTNVSFLENLLNSYSEIDADTDLMMEKELEYQ